LIVADTSALIAMLRLEPEAPAFMRAIIESENCLVAAPTALEFIMVAQGGRFDNTAEVTSRILSGPYIQVVPWTDALVEIAQTAYLNFGKGKHPASLNFGDCMSYALAKSLGCPLLYKGEDFAKTDIVSAI
jgi:ribonuclease VapC